ncbi:hypothetical protein COU57_05385 [Candidatus Pacearchaeota archaeon CG10_big_fil_rev_8_21_14_0_10_32_14]|nr:MAG: hypothetical protein COU57_05385 [Candidatus Pacearchaeota archaeon CG10_big_fil_rev_8_21_14_0_10_32_14]
MKDFNERGVSDGNSASKLLIEDLLTEDDIDRLIIVGKTGFLIHTNTQYNLSTLYRTAIGFTRTTSDRDL